MLQKLNVLNNLINNKRLNMAVNITVKHNLLKRLKYDNSSQFIYVTSTALQNIKNCNKLRPTHKSSFHQDFVFKSSGLLSLIDGFFRYKLINNSAIIPTNLSELILSFANLAPEHFMYKSDINI